MIAEKAIAPSSDKAEIKSESFLSRFKQRHERAYVVVFLAVVMSGLLTMAGFATDLGFWYLRTSQIQRASDAAALAGAAAMPNVGMATTAVHETLTENGFDWTDTTRFDLTVTTGADGKILVDLKDKKVPTFFTSAFLHNISLDRHSWAEQIAPLPMGTPYNVLGTGPYDPSGGAFGPQNFVLAAGSYCTPKEQGDFFSAGFDGSYAAPDYDKTNCSSSTTEEANSDYRSTGYDYIVTVPKDAGSTRVRLYSPAYEPGCENYRLDGNAPFPQDKGFTYLGAECSGTYSQWYADRDPNATLETLCFGPGPYPHNTPAGNLNDPAASWGRYILHADQPCWPNGYHNLQTKFTVYDTHGTQTHADDTLVSAACQSTWGSMIGEYSPAAGVNFAYGASKWDFPKSTAAWVDFPSPCNISPGVDGSGATVEKKYRVNVGVVNSTVEVGINGFGIGAFTSAITTNNGICDSRVPANVDKCPTVAGEGAMAVYSSAQSPSGWNRYYLADVPTEYKGEEIQVKLWDAGEGFTKLRLVSPHGDIVPVKPQLDPDYVHPPTPGLATGVQNEIAIDDSRCGGYCESPGTGLGRWNHSLTNDRMLILTAKIPDDYGDAGTLGSNGSTYWYLEYGADHPEYGEAHDTTTWMVSIGGHSPVHLVHED